MFLTKVYPNVEKIMQQITITSDDMNWWLFFFHIFLLAWLFDILFLPLLHEIFSQGHGSV